MAAGDEFKAWGALLIESLFRAGQAFSPNPINNEHQSKCRLWALAEMLAYSTKLAHAFNAPAMPASQQIYEDKFREFSLRELHRVTTEIEQQLGTAAAKLAGEAAANSLWAKIRKPVWVITGLALLFSGISALANLDGAIRKLGQIASALFK